MPLRNSRTAAVLACAVALAAGSGAAPAQAQQLLPDLDQQTPNGLTIAGGGRHFELGFQSAVRNVGDGPLIIAGSRPSTRTPLMSAQQLIVGPDGQADPVPTPSRLRYAVSRTHQHWHLLRFDRYLLRRAGDERTVVRDQKTGFCLGDRYRVQARYVPRAPEAPHWTGSCGRRQRSRLSIGEGISPGYGDNYLPYLEGQSLPLTGLPSGRYVLVHTVNSGRALRESDYGNDSASVLLDLRWRKGRPVVGVLATCPDTERCDELSSDLSARPVPLLLGQTVPDVGVADVPPAGTSDPVDRPTRAAAAARNCVMAQEDRATAAGDSGEEDEDAPPKFSSAFYRTTFTLEVSLDGADGRDLPVSIEEVCGVPRARAKEAMQLAGADGVAVIYRKTKVTQGRTRLTGDAATTAVDGADTATLRVRLARPKSWRADEDGGRVPTFKTLRLDITD